MKHKKQITKVVRAAKRADNSQVASKTIVKAPLLKYPKGKYFEGIGRRRVATARVRIYPEKGEFIVNDKLVKDYFSDLTLASVKYLLPFKITKTEGDFAVTARISGSGKSAQLEALVHGLARALEKFDPKVRPFLKNEGLLTRDSRMKETRKPGRGGKARRKRQSPKR